MKRGFYTIMAAQFFSSLADNALFISCIALIQMLDGPSWMTPMVKWGFAVSYVVLAAFVGAFADALPKGRVMFITNTIKIVGCFAIFFYDFLRLPGNAEFWVVFAGYMVVGIGAAMYSPAKYGILTELLPPEQLVKGNGWIEGLTVVSIIFGTVLGGALISPKVSTWLLSFDLPVLSTGVDTPPEAAILVIAVFYAIAAIFNLNIPDTGARYPKQETNPIKLVTDFWHCVEVLWKDKLGQISLAVTTLFWGAGATLQLMVLEWGKSHLGLRLDQASMLMGVASVGTIVGAIVAGRYMTLKNSLTVLPFGIGMGFVVMLMPFHPRDGSGLRAADHHRRAGRILRRADERAASASRPCAAVGRAFDRGAEFQRTAEYPADGRGVFGDAVVPLLDQYHHRAVRRVRCRDDDPDHVLEPPQPSRGSEPGSPHRY